MLNYYPESKMPFTIRHITLSKNEWIYYGLMTLFGLFILLSSFWEPFKYLKYTMPFVSLLLLYAGRNYLDVNITQVKLSKKIKYLLTLLTFYLIAFTLNFVKGFHDPRFYAESFFVLSPLVFTTMLTILLPERDISKGVPLLFFWVTLSFIAEKFGPIVQSLLHPAQLIHAFLTSELDSESNYSFQFGMFLLVFLWNRQKKLSVLSALLLIISFKRIAILAVLFIGLLYAIEKITKGKLQPAKNRLLLLLFNIVVVSLLFLFFNGNFDELIESTFGVGPNFLTQGRYDIYQDIFAHFGRSDLLGFGLGSINTFLSGAGYQLVNLHSDVLKVFFELGPVLFLCWITVYYYHVQNFLTASLAIYLNILFFTDNVFIYFDVLFVFYFLMLYSFQFDEKQPSTAPIGEHYNAGI